MKQDSQELDENLMFRDDNELASNVSEMNVAPEPARQSEQDVANRTSILFQAPNGIGLGHISRLAAIALALRQRHPQIRSMFLLEGGSHHLLESLDIPYLSVPNRGVLASGSWAQWTPDEQLGLITKIASAIIRSVKPRSIVFDSFPVRAVAEVAIQLKVPIVLSLRKMRDMAGYFADIEAADRFLDLVIFPHERGEIVVPDWLAHKSRFVGNVVRPTVIAQVPQNTRAGKLVIITGGGGGYAGTVDFYNRALTALANCRNRYPSLEVTLIAGPLFQQWKNLELIAGVRVVPFAPDLPVLLAEADLVICQAGYNTIAEILQLGVPAICLPAPRPGDDQFERAKHAAFSSENITLWQETGTLTLEEVIARELEKSRRPPYVRINAPGAQRAADAIYELIEGTEPCALLAGRI